MLCKDCGRELEAKIAPGDLLCPDCRRNRIEKQKLEFAKEQERRREQEEKNRKLEEEKREREKESELNRTRLKQQFDSSQSEHINFYARILEQWKRPENKETLNNGIEELFQLYRRNDVQSARKMLINQVSDAYEKVNGKVNLKLKRVKFLLIFGILLSIFLLFYLLMFFSRLFIFYFLSFPFIIAFIIFTFVRYRKRIAESKKYLENVNILSEINAKGLLSGLLKIKNEKAYIMHKGNLKECCVYQEKKTEFGESYLEKIDKPIASAYFEPITGKYYVDFYPESKDMFGNLIKNRSFDWVQYGIQCVLHDDKLIKSSPSTIERNIMFLEFDYEDSDSEIYNRDQMRNHFMLLPTPSEFLKEKVLNQPRMAILHSERFVFERTISNYGERFKGLQIIDI